MKKNMISAGIVILIAVFLFCLQASAESLTPELCRQKAKEAAELLKTLGDNALDKLKDPDGGFIFAGGSGYVWVHNLDGVMIMHPIKPSLDGKGLLDMRDVNGVFLFVAMNELVEEQGEGWVSYSWPKPGEKASSPKVSYVVLVTHKDREYVVGSGMYDVTADDIKKRFPGDAIYEN